MCYNMITYPSLLLIYFLYFSIFKDRNNVLPLHSSWKWENFSRGYIPITVHCNGLSSYESGHNYNTNSIGTHYVTASCLMRRTRWVNCFLYFIALLLDFLGRDYAFHIYVIKRSMITSRQLKYLSNQHLIYNICFLNKQCQIVS